MASRCTAVMLLLWTSICLWSCAPAATYPPTEGTVSMGPSSPPIPELMAESVRFTNAREGRGEPVVINLPPNTPPNVWEEVLRRLPDARPMLDAGELAYHVQQVRLDGSNAEVDLIYRRENFNQLTTVVFEGAPFRPWRALYLKNWRVITESPGPNYPASAMEAYKRADEWAKRP